MSDYKLHIGFAVVAILYLYLMRVQPLGRRKKWIPAEEERVAVFDSSAMTRRIKPLREKLRKAPVALQKRGRCCWVLAMVRGAIRNHPYFRRLRQDNQIDLDSRRFNEASGQDASPSKTERPAAEKRLLKAELAIS